jgi:hypothetical protein
LALREIFDPLQVGYQHIGVVNDVVGQFTGQALKISISDSPCPPSGKGGHVNIPANVVQRFVTQAENRIADKYLRCLRGSRLHD